MKIAILCLCLASAVSAAPGFFHYLPHYGGPRQSAPPTQNEGQVYQGGQPLPQGGIVNSPVSMEIVFPQRFQSRGTGAQITGPQSYPSQAFIKYSLPKAPGRKSVEIYYPYDFVQQKMRPNLPQMPDMFPYEYPPNTMPQQLPHISPYDARLPHSQEPMQVQQEQLMRTGQVPVQP